MLIERELERKVGAAFAEVLPKGTRIALSRAVEDEGEIARGDPGADCLCAVAASFRSHAAFSLPMLSVPVAVTVATPVERDPTGAAHESAVEAVAALLSRWHYQGAEMSEALSTGGFSAAELKISGGTGRTLDRERGIRTDTATFDVTGSEIFTDKSENDKEND